MLVTSNTSPICNLAMIGRLDLLRDQFGSVWIPDAVRIELDRLSNPAASRAARHSKPSILSFVVHSNSAIRINWRPSSPPAAAKELP